MITIIIIVIILYVIWVSLIKPMSEKIDDLERRHDEKDCNDDLIYDEIYNEMYYNDDNDDE